MAIPTRSDPQFKLRIPADLKDRVEKAAASNSRSVTAEMIEALEAVFPKLEVGLLLEEVLHTIERSGDLLVDYYSDEMEQEIDSLADDLTEIKVKIRKASFKCLEIEERMKKSGDST